MPITSLDAAIAGMRPPEVFSKVATPTLVAGRPHSLFYLAGVPGAAVAPTPGVAGTALTALAGQIPVPAPGGAGVDIHLARLQAQVTIPGTLILADRLWHNSGLVVTTTTAQTVNSVAFPPRCIHGTTEGHGVLIGMEVTGATGAGTPALSMSYTNQAGTAGRTAASIVPVVASGAIGAFYPMGLDVGDTGVRSVQTFQWNATMTSGSVSLVAYRELARLEITAGNTGFALDALTGGFPRVYNNSVPFLIFIPQSTTASVVGGHVIFSQG